MPLLALLLACVRAPAAPEPPAAPAPPPLPDHLLFGFWGLNGVSDPTGLASLKERLHLSLYQVASEDPAYTLGHTLPEARAAGIRVTLRLAGDHPAYTDRLGRFDLDAWKAGLERWRGKGLEPYVADGTLWGHMLLDDIHNFPTHDPDAAELDELARYSRTLWPGLATFVREKATGLPEPEGGRYRWLDAQVNQYEVKEGPVDSYVAANRARADALGIRSIHGLNIADGGDGSSGQPGWRQQHWAMSAAEIRRYGPVLLNDPGCAAFLAWEYDARERWSDGTVGATYLQRPELEAALAELGRLALTRPGHDLFRPDRHAR